MAVEEAAGAAAFFASGWSGSTSSSADKRKVCCLSRAWFLVNLTLYQVFGCCGCTTTTPMHPTRLGALEAVLAVSRIRTTVPTGSALLRGLAELRLGDALAELVRDRGVEPWRLLALAAPPGTTIVVPPPPPLLPPPPLPAADVVWDWDLDVPRSPSTTIDLDCTLTIRCSGLSAASILTAYQVLG